MAVLVLVAAAVITWFATTPPPLVAGVARDPGNVVRGQVQVVTSEPTDVTIEVSSPDGDGWTITPPEPIEGTMSIPLLGLRADRTYEVTLDATSATAGSRRVSVGRLTTPALPDSLPTVTATTPGRGDDLTVFDTVYRAPGGEGGLEDSGAVMAVDATGAVVWYQHLPDGTEDLTRTAEGTLLATFHETGIRELDPAFGTVREWTGRSGRKAAGPDAVQVATDQMHHEVVELDNGNLLTLSREIRPVDYGAPMCDDDASADEGGSDDAGTEQVAADVVVEFDPETGEIVREHSLFDAVDPRSEDSRDRIIASEFCSPYLEPRYPQGDVRDWTHANAVEVDEARNVVWVSARHLDQLLALRWRDDADGPAGELVWRLGPGGDFELADGGEWFYHQHAPEVQPDGSLLLYDNGNWRPGTDIEDPQNPPYSRAVRYELDTDTMVASQVWEHRFPDEEMVYAPYIGDADALDDGTVLITHGGLMDPPAESPNDPDSIRWGRIVEVEEATDEIVLDLTVRDREGRAGWGVYRSERLPHLYPDGWTVEAL